ncbi:MAG: phage major capsid protein [Acidobacteriia bacterium]|nr:phage major capsid protein [Terriglobia bacterium]
MSALFEVRQRLAEKQDQITELSKSSTFSEARHATLKGEITRLEAQVRAIEENEARNGGPVITRSAYMPEADRLELDRRERAAFDIVLRGKQNNAPRALRSYLPMTDQTTVGGAFLVPVGVGADVSSKLVSFGNLASKVRIWNTSIGDAVSWPTVDSTAEPANGHFIDDNAPFSQESTTNPVFGRVPINITKTWESGLILAPARLVQDSAFDLLSVLTYEVAQRQSRAIDDLVVNGDGASTGVVNISGTNTLAQASPTAITFAEICDLESKLQAGYNANACYCFNSKTYRYLRALNTSGVKHWEAQEFTNGLINNKPYRISESMPDIGSGKKAVALADWSQVVVRMVDRLRIAVFKEIFMSNLEVGFGSYQRFDSAVLQPSAIAFLAGA